MEQLAKNIDEIKRLFPDEWVLVGNPVMDDTKLKVISGIPVLHSKDKREVSYLGREKVRNLETYTVIYTGVITHKRVLPGIFNRVRK